MATAPRQRPDRVIHRAVGGCGRPSWHRCGLLGMPAVLLGLLLGGVAWSGGYGAAWGRATVLGVFGLVGLYVFLELLG